MNIWFVNYYCSPPEFDTHGRHLAFARHLQERGHHVTLIMAGAHGERVFVSDFGRKKYKNVQYGDFSFVHIKCANYKGNSIKRMLSIFQFAWRVYRYRKHFKKPDVIMHNIHAPFDYYVCKCAKKMKVRYIAEEWDLWPENFVKYGLISEKNIFTRWAYSIERRMYEAATDVVGADAGLLDYWKEKGWLKEVGGRIDGKRFHYINNGIDLQQFKDNSATCIVDDKDLLREDKFKVVYLGSIKKVNDVKRIIDAISIINDSTVVLLIYGDGDQRNYLERYCIDNDIHNVLFKEKRVSYAQCAYVVSRADINIMNYAKGFASRGCSAGKMMLALAAGKPIVCNVKIAYDDVITDNNLGVCEELETPQQYSKAILKIRNLSKDQYNDMCGRVKKTAQKFDYNYLAECLIKVIEKK